MRGLLQGLVTWLRAAEGAVATAEHAAPKVWRAELADVHRLIEQLRRRVEALADEMNDGGPAGPPFDPP